MYPKIEKATHNFDGMKNSREKNKKQKHVSLTSIKKIIMCAEILVFF
jgi:hypothetical protein